MTMNIRTAILSLAIASLGLGANGCYSVDCRAHPEDGDRCDTSDKYVCRQTDSCASLGCADTCVCLDGHWSCAKRCIDGTSDLCGAAPMCWRCSSPPEGIEASAPPPSPGRG
jgi:hypothetical protein